MVTETLKIHNSHYTVSYEECESEKIHLIIELINSNLKRIARNIAQKQDKQCEQDKMFTTNITGGISTDLSMLLIMLVIEQQEKLMLFESYENKLNQKVNAIISKLEMIKKS